MKSLSGKVISTKMPKTIVVEIERKRFHPLYKKLMRRTKKYKVHCLEQNVKVGDLVEIVATRPISKEKHYKFVKLLK